MDGLSCVGVAARVGVEVSFGNRRYAQGLFLPVFVRLIYVAVFIRAVKESADAAVILGRLVGLSHSGWCELLKLRRDGERCLDRHSENTLPQSARGNNIRAHRLQSGIAVAA